MDPSKEDDGKRDVSQDDALTAEVDDGEDQPSPVTYIQDEDDAEIQAEGVEE